jgi:hypothetical protein
MLFYTTYLKGGVLIRNIMTSQPPSHPPNPLNGVNGVNGVNRVTSTIKYLHAPEGLGVKYGTKLRVQMAVLTDDSCPLGSGLVCYKLSLGLLAVETKPKEYSWFKL